MKKIKTITLLVMFLATTSLYADINNLLKGVVVNDTTLNELSTSTTPNAFAYGISWLGQKSVGGGTVAAFIKIPNSTNLYSFSSSQILYLTDFDTRKLLGNWPLTRWEYLYYPDERIEIFTSLGTGNQEFGKPSYSRYSPGAGCYGNQPLRYGSIQPGDSQEIFLFLTSQLIVFSPEYKRIVFAEIYDNSDWIDAQETTALVVRNTRNETPQFASALIADNGGNAEPGMRFYSKVFVGDFDKDNSTDVLVWRKYYRSNLRDNQVAGFTLKRNEWQHFERDLKVQADLPAGVTGEYLPQATDAATIQAWLSDNNLTWSKGYPDFSECPGEEGKLIPAMHDPLLNDPDVLK